MAYFDGSIHAVPEQVLEDIDVLADYATGTDEEHVANAAARLEAYVRNYKIAQDAEDYGRLQHS